MKLPPYVCPKCNKLQNVREVAVPFLDKAISSYHCEVCNSFVCSTVIDEVEYEKNKGGVKMKIINENKIIDWEKKGNQVRFYLGEDSLKKWNGDDWDDAPYEHNAGTVYDEYIKDERDITFDFDDLVFEPADGKDNSEYCKEDFLKKKAPIIVVLKKKDIDEDAWSYDYEKVLANEKSLKFYMGDDLWGVLSEYDEEEDEEVTKF